MMQKYQTLEINLLTKSIDYNSITSKSLVDKSAISEFINNSDLDRKLATLATKPELKDEQDKIIKFQAFDSSYFRGKSHFEEDGTKII